MLSAGCGGRAGRAGGPEERHGSVALAPVVSNVAATRRLEAGEPSRPDVGAGSGRSGRAELPRIVRTKRGPAPEEHAPCPSQRATPASDSTADVAADRPARGPGE